MSMSLSTMQIVKDRDIGKDNLKFMNEEFNAFWTAYQPDEIRFPNRRAATFVAWGKRSPAARKAMMDYVKDKGAPKWKNPYFFVIDFPEPRRETLSFADYYARFGTTEPINGWQMTNPTGNQVIYIKTT